MAMPSKHRRSESAAQGGIRIDCMKKSIEITPHIETLFGTRDENLHVLEDGLNINIDLRSNSIEVEGAARDVARAEQVFADYHHLQRSGHTFNNGDLNSMLRVLMADPKATLRGLAEAGHGFRHRPRRYGQDLPGGGDGHLGTAGEKGEPDHFGASGG
jgi:hypothetical protein